MRWTKGVVLGQRARRAAFAAVALVNVSAVASCGASGDNGEQPSVPSASTTAPQATLPPSSTAGGSSSSSMAFESSSSAIANSLTADLETSSSSTEDPTSDFPGDAGVDGGGPDGGNDAGLGPLPGVLPIVHFEPPGRTFGSDVVVGLTVNVARPIHYTLDGSVPSADSPVYTAPLVLEQTTVLRTFVEGLSGPAGYAAQSYMQLAPDAVEFTSNLPIVVVNRHRGLPLDAFSKEYQSSSLLVFMPGADGRAHLLGPADVSYRSGVRVRGAFSRYFPQLSYALETWQAEADEDEAVPLFGMPAEADWVLSAPSEMDRALFRNKFAMDLSRKLGRYAPRAEFMELFLADDPESATVAIRDYKGVYTFMEKIERDAGRVAISKLRETDVEGDALTGGYVFRIDHEAYDFYAGGYDFGWVYPDADEMRKDVRAPQVEYLTGYLEEFFACLTAPGYVHPASNKHYSEYIDVPAWIDHNLLTTLTKNVDGLRLSAYFSKDRGGLLAAGPAWDFDRSLGTPHDVRAEVANEWASGDGTDPRAWGFWADLFSDPDFAEDYWARWDELRADAFRREELVAMVDDYEAQLLEARVRHFERWPELPPLGGADGEVEWVRSWLTERLSFLDEERQTWNP